MRKPAIVVDLAVGAGLTGALALLLAAPEAAAAVITALSVYLAVSVWLVIARRDDAALGWANRVTLLRAAIVCALAGTLAEPALFVDRAQAIVALVVLVLTLDGLDGWLARRLEESSAFGARFDMETDAALILVLCAGLWLSGLAPAWVLAIGLMRPAFLAAGLIHPALSQPLPESFRRKLVCVVQIGALPVALLPGPPEALRLTALAGALLALIASFAIDTTWLLRRHRLSATPEWRTP